MSVKPLVALASLVLLLPVTGRAQEKTEAVNRKASAALLEDILRDLDVRYKKAAGKDGIVYYDFERNNYKMRLSSFDGSDLMLDAIFNPVSAQRMNKWNIRAKFSRGVVYPGAGKPYSALEYNLDCVGGVTSGAIKQFIRRFDGEVKAFDKFLGESEDAAAPPATAPAALETVYPAAAYDLVEKILKGLNLTYTKMPINNGAAFVYDYERNNTPIKLFNFGGKDLMLRAMFRKATLDEANRFNLKRYFIRAVIYNQGGQESTALESNLDVEGGVTESMLRRFITSYDADVKEFARFLAK